MSWDDVSKQSAEAGVWIVADPKGSVTSSGSGVQGFIDAFDDGLIQFGVIRVVGVDKQESVTSERPKMVRVNWVGSNVKPMKKMGALQGKQAISNAWQGCAVEMDVENKSEISMNEIGLGLLKCGGAHKPTEYDFGDAQFSFRTSSKGPINCAHPLSSATAKRSLQPQ